MYLSWAQDRILMKIMLSNSMYMVQYLIKPCFESLPFALLKLLQYYGSTKCFVTTLYTLEGEKLRWIICVRYKNYVVQSF